MFLKSVYKITQSSSALGCSSSPLLRGSPIAPAVPGSGACCRFAPRAKATNWEAAPASQSSGSRAVQPEGPPRAGSAGCGPGDKAVLPGQPGVLGTAQLLCSPAGHGSRAAPAPFSRIRKKEKQGRGFPCAGKALMLLLKIKPQQQDQQEVPIYTGSNVP